MFLSLGCFGQTNIDSCIALWNQPNYILPDVFATMENGTTVDTFYIYGDDPQASDSNNGLYPEYMGGTDGPWKTINGLANIVGTPDSLAPGDVLMLRNGIYDIDTTLGISLYGTADAPIRIQAYLSETPVLNGTFDYTWYYSVTHPPVDSILVPYYEEWNNVPMVRATGRYYIIDGITFANSHLTNLVLVNNDHLIIKNCVFEGSLEDGIKTTESSSNILLLNNEFFDFGGEAIDVFGSENYYICENDFHHAYPFENPRSQRTAAWAKGGADSIFFFNNDFRDLNVANHALILGGCCWNNWIDTVDQFGNLNPVSTNVFAQGNKFWNVQFDSTYIYQGVISFQASRFTKATRNLFYHCGPIMSVKKASQGSQVLAANELSFDNNIIVLDSSDILYSIIDDFDVPTTNIDSNCVYSDANINCVVGSGNSMPYSNFKTTYNFDVYNCIGSISDFCTTVNLSEVNSTEIFIYPNPSIGEVIVKGLDIVLNKSNVQLISLSGKIVDVEFSGENSIIIDPTAKKGLYFLIIYTSQGFLKSFKIIIE